MTTATLETTLKANLHSLVPLAKPTKIAALKTLDTEWSTKLTEFKAAWPVIAKYADRDGRSTIYENFNREVDAVRVSTFQKHLTVPASLTNAIYHSYSELVERPDTISTLAETPRASLSDLRSMADQLGMVIMPYVALDPRSLDTADYQTRDSINRLSREAKKLDLDIYVVAPLALYSILNHVEAKDSSHLMFYSARHESVLSSLAIQLPMFQALRTSVANLDSRVAGLEAAHQQVSTQIKSMQLQLDRLQDKVDKELRQQALAIESLRVKVEALEAIAFRAIDPLMFVVPRNTDLNSDSLALIGPAWGPDLPDILVQLSGMKVIKGQRQRLSSIRF